MKDILAGMVAGLTLVLVTICFHRSNELKVELKKVKEELLLEINKHPSTALPALGFYRYDPVHGFWQRMNSFDYAPDAMYPFRNEPMCAQLVRCADTLK